MKAYLATTFGIFALLAAAHLARSISEWQRFLEDPWFIVEGPGIAVIAGALAVWAWRLRRALEPTGATPGASP